MVWAKFAGSHRVRTQHKRPFLLRLGADQVRLRQRHDGHTRERERETHKWSREIKPWLSQCDHAKKKSCRLQWTMLVPPTSSATKWSVFTFRPNTGNASKSQTLKKHLLQKGLAPFHAATCMEGTWSDVCIDGEQPWCQEEWLYFFSDLIKRFQAESFQFEGQ